MRRARPLAAQWRKWWRHHRPWVALGLLVAGALAAVWVLLVVPWRNPNHPRLGPQRQVHTSIPILGVHTRLTDEVEQTKIQRTLEMVRQMRAAWDVEYFPWNYVQRDGPNQWDWAHTDLVIDHAQRQGLKVIARLDAVPQWARPKDTADTYLDPGHYADYARYVAAFVKRYRGKIAACIIWNEPNLAYEWGYRTPDPGAYSQLLKLSYRAAKLADPNVLVLAAPLAPTIEQSPAALEDTVYLRRLYAAGAAPFFDGLAAHTYGWQNPPEQPAAVGVVNFQRVTLLRQVMVANGDGAKQVYVTETGWNDFPRWIRAVSPTEQVRYSVQAVQLAEHWPWLATLCFWEFRLPAVTHTYNDNWSLVRSDFSPTPLYLALQKLATGTA
ncbi:MAG: hypothetical protein ACRDGF_01235 [Chloroflexota bacterium]